MLQNIHKSIKDLKEQFDSQFKVHNGLIQENEDRQVKIEKMLGRLGSELQKYDEMFKKVPFDLCDKVDDLSKLIGICQVDIGEIKTMASKLNKNELELRLESKLDCNTYYEFLPKNVSPQKHLKDLISTNTEEMMKNLNT